jgi:hypothetical protein
MATRKFRVCGPAVGFKDTWLDMDVRGIGDAARVLLLADDNSGREVQLTTDRIDSLRDDDLLVDADAVANGSTWKTIARAQKTLEDEFESSVSYQRVEGAQKELFRAAVEETR